MPLTSTESRVLDLWDNGSPTREIARTTGLTYARVSQIVETYHVRSNRDHHRCMASASAILRDAILAHFKPMPSKSRSLIWNTRSLAEADAQQGAVA